MLQASIYADRRAADGSVSDLVLEKGRRSLSGLGFRRLVAIAYKAVQGDPVGPLNDHLLQDIGLTRAEFEAMRF